MNVDCNPRDLPSLAGSHSGGPKVHRVDADLPLGSAHSHVSYVLQDHDYDTQIPLEPAPAQICRQPPKDSSNHFTLRTLPASEISFTEGEVPTLNICSPLSTLLNQGKQLGMPAPDAEDYASEECEGYLKPKERRFTLTQFVLENKMKVKLKVDVNE